MVGSDAVVRWTRRPTSYPKEQWPGMGGALAERYAAQASARHSYGGPLFLGQHPGCLRPVTSMVGFDAVVRWTRRPTSYPKEQWPGMGGALAERYADHASARHKGGGQNSVSRLNGVPSL